MNKLMFISMVSLFAVALSMPAIADTTVTVDDNKVIINRNPAVTTTVIHEVVPQTVVVQQVPVIVETTEDPRALEGDIIRVESSENTIVIQDINNRERRVLLKQGMISTYKVGDYVQVYLMADLREAKKIHTVRTADLEGDILVTDYARNQMIVRDMNGVDRVVILSPGMHGTYKVKDHVRLYVVSESPNLKEVRLIRVK